MEGYVVRMIQELIELDSRIERLRSFINNESSNTDDISTMKRQLHFMDGYKIMLQTRLACHKEDIYNYLFGALKPNMKAEVPVDVKDCKKTTANLSAKDGLTEKVYTNENRAERFVDSMLNNPYMIFTLWD